MDMISALHHALSFTAEISVRLLPVTSVNPKEQPSLTFCDSSASFLVGLLWACRWLCCNAASWSFVMI